MSPTSSWALRCSFQEFSLTQSLEVRPRWGEGELGAQRQEALGALRPPSPGERAVARGRKDGQAQVPSTTFLLPALSPKRPGSKLWLDGCKSIIREFSIILVSGSLLENLINFDSTNLDLRSFRTRTKLMFRKINKTNKFAKRVRLSFLGLGL